MTMVRVADAADYEALARLVAGFRDHLEASGPTDAQIAARLPRLLADDRSELAIAFLEEDGAPAVGYTYTRAHPSLYSDGPEVYLEDLFVEPEARGRGVGSALLRFVEERARSAGARVIALSVNERNEQAQGLYRRHGFEAATEPRWEGGREIRFEQRL